MIEMQSAENPPLPIHKNLLCYHVKHYKHEFERCDEFSMGGVTPKCLEHFVNWLYQGKLFYDPDPDTPFDASIIDLYLLGRSLRAPELRNVAIDAFRRACHKLNIIPAPHDIANVYLQTEAGSPMRLLCSRMVAHGILTCDPELDSESCKGYMGLAERCEDFRIDLMKAVKHEFLNGPVDPAEGSGEEYHESDSPNYAEIEDDTDSESDEPASQSAPDYQPRSRSSPSPPPPYSRYPPRYED